MPKLYNTPGVYVEEISASLPVIHPAETAIPAFIGRTEFNNHQDNANNIATKPIKISSFTDYERYFGNASSEHLIFSVSIIDTQTETFNRQLELDVDEKSVSGAYMYYALQMFFGNGGNSCYIASSGDYSSSFDDSCGQACLDAVAQIDEVTMIVFTDKHINKSETSSGYKYLNDLALSQCYRLKDRIAIFNSWVDSTKPINDLKIMRNDVSSENLKYGCMYYPWLQSTLKYEYDEHKIYIKHLLNDNSGAFEGKSLAELKESELYSLIKDELSKCTIDLPPAAAIAGVMAKMDRDRGVWKAPANVAVNQIKLPCVTLTNNEQDLFNIDVDAGKSVNIIKFFAGKGTLVWGARTLAGNDNEWRYIPVRRFFNFVEDSIKKGIESFVFEPNDANSWVRIKTICENFLIQLWRNGALQGIKPEHAFYIKIGLGETMTARDILEGKMIVEIGLAPVRTAEFIIMRMELKVN
ncbi:phage tail sheath family protein [Pedobacter sp.]|uniref:phage tail sheath family protein n=1 Tax=Pedobacter sp. TaxID=1411316 RepID=UPI003BAB5730